MKGPLGTPPGTRSTSIDGLCIWGSFPGFAAQVEGLLPSPPLTSNHTALQGIPVKHLLGDILNRDISATSAPGAAT